MTNELKKLVIEEATKLKQHATKTQLRKLAYLTLNGTSTKNCIYGKMTGDCYSREATRLLNLCATPYSSSINELTDPNQEIFKEGYFVRAVYSPIEYYIADQNAEKKALVDFLKGKRETLTVNDL